MKKIKSPVVYFESTGIYSRPVRTFCEKNAIPYVEMNPLSLHFKTDSLRRLKTDRDDAYKIAKYGIAYPQPYSHMFTPTYQKIRELTRFYLHINDDIETKRTLLDNALQQTFPEVEYFCKSKMSVLSLKTIELFPHPKFVTGLSRTRLKNIILQSTDKNISSANALKKAEKLMRYARMSYPAYQSDSIQVLEVKYYARQLMDLIQQKRALKKQLITRAESLDEFQVFNSFPGIGPLTAATFIGEVGDIRRFSNNRKLNAFIGIDINRYQSGEYTRNDHINKRGDAKARAILYNMVCDMICQQAHASNHIVDYYYRLKKGPYPKKDKVAKVACMNKTVKCLLAMVKANQGYDYSYHGLKVQ